jgi:hypothetical protein
VFSAVDQRKKAPSMVALEPRTLELVRGHRRYLMQRKRSAQRLDEQVIGAARSAPTG